MEIKDLKKRFTDLIVAKLELDGVYSLRDIEKILEKMFGYTIVRYDVDCKKVKVATSKEYGMFIDKLKIGTRVVMTGAEIEMFPEYKDKVWTVEHEPLMMGGQISVWLNGFSGAYCCLMLKLAGE